MLGKLKSLAIIGLRFGFLGGCFLMLMSCSAGPKGRPEVVMIETTGYCPCGECCGWERSWIPPFRPVYSSGPLKGTPKKVGITASGTKAKNGTIAADTRFYSFGTVMKIPGYGMGTVEDRGGKIVGPARIDLFFRTHKQALAWGRRRVRVEIWR